MVMDVRKDVASRLGTKLGVGFTDQLDEALGSADAVSICTPAVTHFDVATQALKRGKHVLVEKPITTRLEDADALVDLAAKQKLILQTGHVERFNGAVKTIKEMVKNPIFIECDRIGIYDQRIADVGVVLDLMIHDIDILLYLVRSTVTDIQAVGMSIFSENEDFVNARLTFASGTVCNITASRMAQKRVRKLRIFEKSRYISMDYYGQEALTFTRNGFVGDETPYQPIDIRKTNSLTDELSAFVACVRENRPPQVRGQEGREALEVALKVLEQIKKRS